MLLVGMVDLVVMVEVLVLQEHLAGQNRGSGGIKYNDGDLPEPGGCHPEQLVVK